MRGGSDIFLADGFSTRGEEKRDGEGKQDKYTDIQKRKAEHIEESYEDRGVSQEEAERRAWATVNTQSSGGNKSGNRVPSQQPAGQPLPTSGSG